MSDKKLILVSNDDGVFAPGLKVLIDVVKPYGDVLVVAPESAESGMSHALSIKNPVRVTRQFSEPGLTIYSCQGTPVDCVKLALNQLVDRKPDFVVSGINHGSNASISIIYSGTMGAALEGTLNGIPSAGFSLLDHSLQADFTLARLAATSIFDKMYENGLPLYTCLNVNVPRITPDRFKGIKVCRQAHGVWKEEYEKRYDPANQPYYWLTGNFHNFEPDATDTDEWALSNNYVSVVPVWVDFTSHEVIEKLSGIFNQS